MREIVLSLEDQAMLTVRQLRRAAGVLMDRGDDMGEHLFNLAHDLDLSLNPPESAPTKQAAADTSVQGESHDREARQLA